MEQAQLAEAAGVGITTIRKMEAFGTHSVRARLDTMDNIVGALRDAGVIFTNEDEGGASVKLVKVKP